MTRTKNPRRFLTDAEQQQVVDAIRAAEKETSGEIRVHLERRCAAEPTQRAIALFEKLGMTATARRNGVLLYLATADRKFAIIGDAGIDAKVPAGFWDQTARAMEAEFRQDRFADGLVAGIRDAGARLREFFPYDPTTDKNELPDGISSGS